MKRFLAVIFCLAQIISYAQVHKSRLVDVAPGWANNSVNAVIFRKNSLVTFRNTQFISFYDSGQNVVLGKRKLGSSHWQLKKTQFTGKATDAHNTISIMVDGNGFLHLSWDHHNNQLHYARSLRPGSLEMSAQLSMTGKNERSVSYPEFYKLANGNLLFIYRDGGSGRGNLVLNRYDTRTKIWIQLQSNLIDGEGQRSAYWQACTDAKGTIHLSWVWRETPDVASNHDLCYARSNDGGLTWQKSNGDNYTLPIRQVNAEIVQAIPQNSELINQTSMVADGKGNPYIATYWRESPAAVPQFHLVYKSTDGWQARDLGFRKTAFSLSGTGTKRIPVSRPQIVAWQKANRLAAALVFRDEERGNKVSVAVCSDLGKNVWQVNDLGQQPVGLWEPTYDTELWKARQRLHLFVQNVEQVDAEGKATRPPQMIKVLEWNP